MSELKEEQFLKLYDEYANAVFRHCYFRVSDREKAKDLMQETFKRVWQHLNNGGQLDSTKGFIFKIANNLIIDTYRKKKEDSLEALMDEGLAIESNDHQEILNMLVGSDIMRVLEQLDEKYRDVIVMRYIDDLSPQEIALVVGETPNNISVRIHRALQKVRDLMKRI